MGRLAEPLGAGSLAIRLDVSHDEQTWIDGTAIKPEYACVYVSMRDPMKHGTRLHPVDVSDAVTVLTDDFHCIRVCRVGWFVPEEHGLIFGKAGNAL